MSCGVGELQVQRRGEPGIHTPLTRAITQTRGINRSRPDETSCSPLRQGGFCAQLSHRRSSDLFGRAYIVRGFSPMSITRPSIHLEDALTGEQIEVAIDELTGKAARSSINAAEG